MSACRVLPTRRSPHHPPALSGRLEELDTVVLVVVGAAAAAAPDQKRVGSNRTSTIIVFDHLDDKG